MGQSNKGWHIPSISSIRTTSNKVKLEAYIARLFVRQPVLSDLIMSSALCQAPSCAREECGVRCMKQCVYACERTCVCVRSCVPACVRLCVCTSATSPQSSNNDPQFHLIHPVCVCVCVCARCPRAIYVYTQVCSFACVSQVNQNE